MNIILTPELEAFVNELVESGAYANPLAVVEAALLLKQKTDHARKLEALRRDIAIGMEQSERGESAPLNMNDIITESQRRLVEKNG